DHTSSVLPRMARTKSLLRPVVATRDDVLDRAGTTGAAPESPMVPEDCRPPSRAAGLPPSSATISARTMTAQPPTPASGTAWPPPIENPPPESSPSRRSSTFSLRLRFCQRMGFPGLALPVVPRIAGRVDLVHQRVHRVEHGL